MSSVRKDNHYHYTTLPSGRKLRSGGAIFDDTIEIGTLGVIPTTVPPYDEYFKIDPLGDKVWDAFGLGSGGFEKIGKAFGTIQKAYGFSKENPPPPDLTKAWFKDYTSHHIDKHKSALDKVGDAVSSVGKAALPIVAGAIGTALLPGVGTALGAGLGSQLSNLGSSASGIANAIPGNLVGAIPGMISGLLPGTSPGTPGTAIPGQISQGLSSIDPVISEAISKTANKADIKKVLTSLPPTVLKQVKKAFQDEKVAKLVEQQKINKYTATTKPAINSIYRQLQKEALQKQATDEHLNRNKINKVIRNNRKSQNVIAKGIINLSRQLKAKNKSQRAVSAAFGIPLVYG